MKPRHFPAAIVGALLAATVRANDVPSKRSAIDLVTHSHVLIERPAAVIWPYIVEPNVWKKGSRLQHVRGPSGEVGEVLAALPADASNEPLFYVKNVELEFAKRRTIKLYEPNNGRLLGFASWELAEQDGKTRVSYHVYTETRVFSAAESQLSETERARVESDELLQNSARFKDELLGLKHLIED